MAMTRAKASQVTAKLDATGSTVRGLDDKLAEFVSVKDFGADPTGAADSTTAIQAAIDAHRGKIFFPVGTYKISSTIIVKEERILIGEGGGAYFSGPGFDRLTVLKPTAGFTGTKVIDVDPANIGAGLSYIYGVALRDLCIDCINIKNEAKTIISLFSLSNTETFDSIRIINNNNNCAIRIGISANVAAFECDGLVFNNIYCLQENALHTYLTPVVAIEAANEVTFRDSKFQRGALVSTVGSTAVYVTAASGRAVNAVTFDSCSFTGANVGLRIEGKNTDGSGPRWIRCLHGTFEGPLYPIVISGTATRPAQFCTIGPGNRLHPVGTILEGVVLGAYASNNTVYADEVTSVVCNENASGNTIFGGQSFTDSGTNNARLFRNANKIDVNGLFIESWTRPTLGASWVDTTASRSQAGYKKDSFGTVYLKGYLTGGTWGFPNYIFTLPAGYRPPVSGRSFEIVATGDTGVNVKIVVLQTGEVFGVGSGTQLCLDGISFLTN
jgi:polygalacturonase